MQLHCPPTPVHDDDRVFDALDVLVQEERIAACNAAAAALPPVVPELDEALREVYDRSVREHVHDRW